MDKTVLYTFFVCNIIHCHGVSLQEQLEHILRTKRESFGINNGLPTRRMVEFNAIFGAPSRPGHLPAAEAILPGHTLLKPTLGMLKSSIKFPHMDMENGAGVYGSLQNLGLEYNNKNSRVLYSGFRRALSDYIMVAPVNTGTRNPKVVLASVVLDLDKENVAKNQILRLYNSLKRRTTKKKRKKKTKQFKKPLELNDILSSESSSSESSHVKLKNIFRQRTEGIKPRSIRQWIKGVRPRGDLRELSEGEENLEPLYTDSDDPFTASNEKNFVDEQPLPISEERPANLTKMELLLQTKDLFNHIKINQDAPNHEELMPKYNKSNSIWNMNNDIRDWWFFHQEDLQSLEAADENY